MYDLDIVDVRMKQVVDTCHIFRRYRDENWTDSANDRCFSFENSPVFWVNKKENSVSLCFINNDYIAKRSSCTQVIWMKKISQEHHVKQDVITLYWKNLRTLIISENLSQTSRNKYSNICHHSFRELIEEVIWRHMSI